MACLYELHLALEWRDLQVDETAADEIANPFLFLIVPLLEEDEGEVADLVFLVPIEEQVRHSVFVVLRVTLLASVVDLDPLKVLDEGEV